MLPTRGGAVLAASSVAVVAGGRFLGLLELYAVGATGLILLLAAAVFVATRRLDVAVVRSVQPHRIHVGTSAVVEVSLRNRLPATTSVLRIRDPVTGTAGADLLLAPLGRLASATVAYRLPTDRRGLVDIGPMTLEIADPFGLVASRLPGAGAMEVTVLPHLDDIAPLARTVGPEPDGAAERQTALGRHGDDFAALRPYVLGDDMRRVHWPSSARTEEDLLVRQDEVPWEGRVCVVLDVRSTANDADTLERAVSVAGSVLRAHVRRGDRVRLVATDGTDSGEGVGPRHLGAVLEFLAVVRRASGGSLRAGLDRATTGVNGAFVFVTGRPSVEDLDLAGRAAGRSSVRRIVRLDADGHWRLPGGGDVIGVGPSRSFVAAWGEVTPRSRSRRGSPTW